MTAPEDAPSPDDADPDTATPAGWRRALGLLGALAAFVVGIQLLRGATATLTPTLEAFFEHYVRGEASAVGFSWLTSYLLANGSIAAAVALTFFENGLLAAGDLLAMVAGTRLGSAGVVILLGAIDFFFRRERTLEEACSMGVLVFVVTHVVTIPAAGLAYLWVAHAPTSLPELLGVDQLRLALPPMLDSMAHGLIDTLGSAGGVVLALALLFLSLKLFDRVLATVDVPAIRERYLSFIANRWLAFLFGLGVTVLTTSIAFSLGLLVPIYNRGHIPDRELIPYIAGASIGTLADTLFIAFLIEPAGGIDATLALIVALLLVSLAALVVHGPFERLCRGLHAWSTRDVKRFALFAVSVVVAPLAMMAVGWLL